MSKPPASHRKALERLRRLGLSYPGAHEKSPWPGHRDLAVRDKTFAYLPPDGELLSISCKLPQSCDAALALGFTTPTGYGLGKSGWVSADFGPKDAPPVELLESWLEESYRAQAPKRLSAQLDGTAPAKGKTAVKAKRTPAKAKKARSTAKKARSTK